MPDYQDSKSLVVKFYAELDAAQEGEINKLLKAYTIADDYQWRGMHPFYELQGSDAVATDFWMPLRQSFTSIQRRQDIFMAGTNDMDDAAGQWVCSMGHLLGLFDRDWLGIPSTGKMIFLRYAEFHCVSQEKIIETISFIDIIGVMQQAGHNPLPPQTGAAIVTPGPRSHDGLLFDRQDSGQSKKTLDLINKMINDLVSADLHSDIDELSRTWHCDMTWFGPAGIGATYTLERYERQHQAPFSQGLQDIQFIDHIVEFAEGNYGCLVGWASLTMESSGGFMGLPSCNKPTEMRLVDIYRREGDKLAENWVFIDLLHFLAKQDLYVLGRMKSINRR